MSKKLKFIWIDDNPKREDEARNIEESLNVNISFVPVSGENITTQLEMILSNKEPDLILMDHWLKKVNSKLLNKGSTTSEILRANWPAVPIVCITGMRPQDIDAYKKSLYEDVIKVTNISKHYTTLLSISKSFKKLRSHPIENVDELLDMLSVPSDDRERLIYILPDMIKRNFGDKSLPVIISKWVRKTLISKPGFLYDKLWAATLIGIKEKSFEKVEQLFTKAKYKGIFADESNDRWWQSSLRKILSSYVDDPESIYSWEQGRYLKPVEKSDYSKCYISGEPFPETVAFIDEAATKRVPMRLRNTIKHPHFEDALYFEEIRMMKGKK